MKGLIVEDIGSLARQQNLWMNSGSILATFFIGSIFCQVNDNWRIGLQGINRTHEIIHTRAAIDDDLLNAPRSWFINDRLLQA